MKQVFQHYKGFYQIWVLEFEHPGQCFYKLKRAIESTDLFTFDLGNLLAVGSYKVEAALMSSPYVDNIMVYADPYHNYCVALVTPLHSALEKWAQQSGIEYKKISDLCDKAEAIKEVQSSLLKAAKESRLDKFEIPAKIKLLPESWTPESGLVTAALKLKREQIKAKLKNELDKLYS